MMRSVAPVLVGLGVILFSTSEVAVAQTGEILSGLEAIRAIVRGPEEVRVGKTIVLDASASIVDPESVRYRWLLDGVIISNASEAVLTFERPGEYLVTLAVTDRIAGQDRRAEVNHVVTAYDRKIVLLAGASVPSEKVEVHGRAAMEEGIFLAVIPQGGEVLPVSEEDQWLEVIRARAATLIGADAVIVWAEGLAALTALARASASDESLQLALRDQTVAVILEGALGPLSRITAAPFTALRLRRLVLTRREALPLFLSIVDVETFLQELLRRDVEHRIVDRSTLAVRPWNLLSTLVNGMVIRGVPSQTVVLLLMLPVIATIVTFLKQVVGVTTLGLTTPAIIALSFVILGWQIGLILLTCILVAGYLAREFTDRVRLLHLPRIAIILTVICLVLLLVLAAGSLLGLRLAPEVVVVLLILSTLVERFVSIKVEEGWRSAIITTAEVVGVAIVCYAVVQWGALRSLLLAYPESLIGLLIVDVVLGRFTGLRVREYVRFREVFAHLREE